VSWDAGKRMKILVAGAQGQLARALAEAARRHGSHQVVALGRPQLDLLDHATIAKAMADLEPDLLVNAAAYTAVDKAESDMETAFAVNRDGAGALAAAARASDIPITHVSTDYVFDGRKIGAYVETDATNPLGVYAKSKLEGELAVASANPRHLILRTAWLYAPYGANFLRTMLRLARERPELRVVDDQHGQPTYVPHLAEAILAIAKALSNKQGQGRWGTYHIAAGGETTWHGFAGAIVRAGARLGTPQVPVIPITTAEYPTLATRPANSRLDCSKLERTFGVRLPHWQQGLAACIAEIEKPAAS
jgi:dTDP-4-dehydrorhamnose reductase